MANDINIDDDDLELDIETSDSESADESSRDESTNQAEKPSDPRAEPEPEPEDADYSKRVKKRIDKEVFRRKSAEERESRLTAELAALRADLEAIKSRNATVDAQTVEGTLRDKLMAARQRLEQAEENADSKAKVDAVEQIAELRMQQREFERERQRQAEAPRQPVQPQQPIPAGAQQWLERNPWFMAGQHPALAQLAKSLDGALQEEGYSPHDPDMYVELSKRLKVAMPKAAHVIGDLETVPMRKRDSGPPTASSSPDGQSVSPKKRNLTQADLTEMVSFGLNPQSKEDRLAWLRAHQA